MDKQVPLLARWASPQSHSVPGIHAAGLPDERVSYRRRRNQVDLQKRANSLLQLETQPSLLTDKSRRQKGRRTSEAGRASQAATRQRQHPTQPSSEPGRREEMPSEDSLAEPVSTTHFTGQQGSLLSSFPAPPSSARSWVAS